MEELDTEKGDDLETIRERLTDVAAWVQFAGRDAAIGFPRTMALAPEPFHEKRADVVKSVVECRRQALRTEEPVSVGSLKGRLLGYAPDSTVWDGAAEYETDGFFRVDDAPPWDLWVGYIYEPDGRNYLVSWIPLDLVGSVEKGIDVNPVECIFWLDELEAAVGLR